MFTSLPSTKRTLCSSTAVLTLILLNPFTGSAQITFEPANTGFNRAEIRCFEFAQDKSTLIGTRGGVYRLGAESDHWEPLSINVNTHAIERTPTGTLLAGTANGVFRSTDNGETWTTAYTTPGIASFCFPADSLVFAADGIGRGRSDYHYVSSDDGQTWQILTIPYLTGRDARIIANSKGIIFYNAANNIAYSKDKGKTWGRTSFDRPPSPPTVTTNDVLVTSTSGTDHKDIIYESADDGLTWIPVDTASGNVTQIKAGENGSYYFAVADLLHQSLTDPSFQNGVYKRITGQMGSELIFAPTTPTAMRFDGPKPWIGADDSPYTAGEVPGEWIPVNKDLANVQIEYFATDENERLYVLIPETLPDSVPGTNSALYRSANLAESWSKVATGFGADHFAVDRFGALYAFKDSGIWVESEPNVWAPTSNRQLLHSTDYGETWEVIADKAFTDIASNATSGTIAIRVKGDILLSRNKGNSWERLTETVWQDSLSIRHAQQLAVLNNGTILFSAPRNFLDPTKQDERGIYRISSDNIIEKVVDDLYAQDFYLAKDGSVLATANKPKNNAPIECGIYRSVNGGKNWEQIFETAQPLENLFHIGGDYILAYYDNQTYGKEISYISTDNGITWTGTLSLNGQEIYVSSVIIGDGNILYGTNSGNVVQSTDGGSSWESATFEGFHGSVSTPLIPLSGYVFGGTDNHGVNKSVERVSSAREEPTHSTEEGASFAVTPSSNSNELTLRFRLPERDDVAFELYDLLGQNVAKLGHGTYRAGEHHLTMQLPDLPTGAYMLVMNTSSEVLSTIVQLQ